MRMRLLNLGTSIAVLTGASWAFAGWQDSGAMPPTVSLPVAEGTMQPMLGPPSVGPPTCCPPMVGPAPVVAAPVGYRPIVALRPLPPAYAVGRGIVGQPKVYVPGQPLRNFVRYLSP